MRVEPVPTTRKYTIEDSDTGLRITIRSRGDPLSSRWRVLLGLVTLIFVGYLIFAIVIAFTRGRYDSVGEHFAYLVMMPVMMFLSLFALLRYALGTTEIIEARPTALVIRPVLLLGHKALPVGRPRA